MSILGSTSWQVQAPRNIIFAACELLRSTATIPEPGKQLLKGVLFNAARIIVNLHRHPWSGDGRSGNVIAWDEQASDLRLCSNFAEDALMHPEKVDSLLDSLHLRTLRASGSPDGDVQ